MMNYTFYTSCDHYDAYNWYYESRAEYGTRKINQTLTHPGDMDYIDTHIRLYALSGIPVGGTMPSNNIELGYRWGTPTVGDLTMTRGQDSYYSIGYNTFSVMPFTGTDSKSPGG